MKVLIVNTTASGGAAIAALRLHMALLKEGVDSKFLTMRWSNNNLPKVFRYENIQSALWKKILYKFRLLETKSMKNHKSIRSLNGTYEIFTFPVTDYNILEHKLVQQADIINLHWVANFLDWPSFFKGINKPVVWTLHDMNPFQGGFHYAEDRQRNKQVFSALDNKLLEIKRLSLDNSTNISIVTPSKWLMYESRKSAILGGFPHYHIPNSLDFDIFKPYQESFAREVFSLPQHKRVFLFVSESMSNHRKGIDLLMGALEILERKFNLVAVAIGRKPEDETKFKGIHFLGVIQDERLMALAYSSADAFVLPSREDNLPNVMLEALACGTPVIGFNVGGISDAIQHGVNGLLANEISASSLAAAIEDFILGNMSFSHDAIRASAIKKYSNKVQAQEYVELYKKSLGLSDSLFNANKPDN